MIRAPGETRLTGFDPIRDPLFNKGTAFTESERDAFALRGLPPLHVGTIEERICRSMQAKVPLR